MAVSYPRTADGSAPVSGMPAEKTFMKPSERKTRTLESFSLGQLEQLVIRLESLVQDTTVVRRLPDGGAKVRARLEKARERAAMLRQREVDEVERRKREKEAQHSTTQTQDTLSAEAVGAAVDDLLIKGMQGVSISGATARDGRLLQKPSLPKALNAPAEESWRRGPFESMSEHRLHQRQRKSAIIMNGNQSLDLAVQTQEAERKYKMARARAKLLTLAKDPNQHSTWASLPSTLPTSNAWRDVVASDESDEDDNAYDSPSDEDPDNGDDELPR